MTHTVLFWITLAVLLFWALGAYNRMVRMRAQVKTAFVAVENRLTQVLERVTERVGLQAAANDADAGPDAAPQPDPLALDGLRGAAAQLEVALRVASRRPLDAPAVAALRTACAALQTSWERLQADPPDPELALNQRAWEDQWQVTREAFATCNLRVHDYNRAIAQFPAVVLAYFFGFRAADGL
ncbi:MAG: hypothetical protein ABI434_19255 [Burkholderiaceae bacterium]